MGCTVCGWPQTDPYQLLALTNPPSTTSPSSQPGARSHSRLCFHGGPSAAKAQPSLDRAGTGRPKGLAFLMQHQPVGFHPSMDLEQAGFWVTPGQSTMCPKPLSLSKQTLKFHWSMKDKPPNSMNKYEVFICLKVNLFVVHRCPSPG